MHKKRPPKRSLVFYATHFITGLCRCQSSPSPAVPYHCTSIPRSAFPSPIHSHLRTSIALPISALPSLCCEYPLSLRAITLCLGFSWLSNSIANHITAYLRHCIASRRVSLRGRAIAFRFFPSRFRAMPIRCLSFQRHTTALPVSAVPLHFPSMQFHATPSRYNAHLCLVYAILILRFSYPIHAFPLHGISLQYRSFSVRCVDEHCLCCASTSERRPASAVHLLYMHCLCLSNQASHTLLDNAAADQSSSSNVNLPLEELRH